MKMLGKFFQRHAYYLIAIVPLVFTIVTWSASDGVPYFTDNNETYSAYAHARNMDMFGVANNAMLTDDGVGLHPEAHPFTYTHQGNLPRYFSYVFRKIGVLQLENQVLLAALICIVLSFWLGRRAFTSTAWAPLMPFFMFLLATDFLGVLQWWGNLFRTWHIPLFFCLFACVYWRKAYWLAFVSVFLLFQMEFTYAAFTAGAFLLSVAATYRTPGSIIMAGSVIAASVLSVSVFIVQLVAHLGWDGFLYDLSTTFTARNSTLVEWDEIKAFYFANDLVMWPSFDDTNHGFGKLVVVTARYGQLMYGRGVWEFACFGLFLSTFIWIGKGLSAHWFAPTGPLHRVGQANARLSVLLWPVIIAYLVVGFVLSGYVMSSYVQRWGPMLNFPVMFSAIAGAILFAEGLSTALVHIGVRRGLDYIKRWGGRAILVGLALGWVMNSIDAYRKVPLFVHEPAELLATRYMGQSFVTNTTYPHMISHYTGKWSYYSPLVFGGRETLDQSYNWNADRLESKDYEQPSYYLCQEVPYRTDVECDDIAKQMVALGHELVDRGNTFAILKLNWRKSTN